MKQDLLYIEADNQLFRGLGRLWPTLAWDTSAGAWKVLEAANPQPEPWGQLVTPREAERLYPGSTSSPAPAGVETTVDLDGADIIRFRPELFDGYDGPVFRKSQEEEEEAHAYFQSLAKRREP